MFVHDELDRYVYGIEIGLKWYLPNMWAGTVDADGSAPGHLLGHLSYRPAATTVISTYAKEVKFLV